MFDWLNRVLGRAPQVRLSAEEESCLEELVEIADGKIRLADDYRQKLAPLFVSAREQVRQLILQVPSAVMLTPEGWRASAELGCAFASPERMIEIVNADDSLHQWFSDHPLADSAFAILSMNHEVVTRYGMEEEGGIVRHDVPQEILVLREHRLGRPTQTLEALSHLACHRAMEELASHAGRRIRGLIEDRTEIEDEINAIKLTLRIKGLMDEYETDPEQRTRKQKLDRLQDELQRVRAELDPENLLAILASALQNPEQQLRFSQISLYVDSLSVIRKPGANTREVNFIEIEMMEEDPERRVLMPVEIPRSLMRPRPRKDENDFLNLALL